MEFKDESVKAMTEVSRFVVFCRRFSCSAVQDGEGLAVKCRDAFVVSYTVKTSRGSSPHRVRRIDVADASTSVVEWSSHGTASS